MAIVLGVPHKAHLYTAGHIRSAISPKHASVHCRRHPMVMALVLFHLVRFLGWWPFADLQACSLLVEAFEWFEKRLN